MGMERLKLMLRSRLKYTLARGEGARELGSAGANHRHSCLGYFR
jgi:hypothetical protein